MDPKEYLTVEEVAARLKVTPEIIRDWLRTGRLGGFRLGGPRAGWRVTSLDLAAFEARQRRHGPPVERVE